MRQVIAVSKIKAACGLRPIPIGEAMFAGGVGSRSDFDGIASAAGLEVFYVDGVEFVGCPQLGLSTTSASVNIYRVSEAGRVEVDGMLTRLREGVCLVRSRTLGIHCGPGLPAALRAGLPVYGSFMGTGVCADYERRMALVVTPEQVQGSAHRRWMTEDELGYLLSVGWDGMGAYVLGEGNIERVQRALDRHSATVVSCRDRAGLYPKIVLAMGDHGLADGSADERVRERHWTHPVDVLEPCFTANVESRGPVFVRYASKGSLRAQELLVEHIAGEVVRKFDHRLMTSTEYVEGSGWVFLEALRTDRSRHGGRVAVVRGVDLDALSGVTWEGVPAHVPGLGDIDEGSLSRLRVLAMFAARLGGGMQARQASRLQFLVPPEAREGSEQVEVADVGDKKWEMAPLMEVGAIRSGFSAGAPLGADRDLDLGDLAECDQAIEMAREVWSQVRSDERCMGWVKEVAKMGAQSLDIEVQMRSLRRST